MKRDCLRCGSKMEQGYKMKLNHKVYDIVITKEKGGFFNKTGKPSVSICPKCGEVSIYLEEYGTPQEKDTP